MSDIYLSGTRGAPVLSDGRIVLGSCFCHAVGAKVAFSYSFVSEPTGQYATGGEHMIGAGVDPINIINSSTSWYSGWSNCANFSGCSGGAIGKCFMRFAQEHDYLLQNVGCAAGRAAIRLVFGMEQTLNLFMRDNRQWLQPWSSEVDVTVEIYDISPGTKVVFNGNTITRDRVFIMNAGTKTSTNTVNWSSSIAVQAA